jgi:hypothetical protein
VLCGGFLQANLLATCGADATVQLFDLANQRQVSALAGATLQHCGNHAVALRSLSSALERYAQDVRCAYMSSYTAATP